MASTYTPLGVEKMATTVDGVNVLGTLTAQLIDGGSY